MGKGLDRMAHYYGLIRRRSGIAALALAIFLTALNGVVFSSDDYVIGAEDVLQISVWGNPELSITAVPVRPDGKVSAPLVGDVQASGLTPNQLQEKLAEKIKEFVQNPHVTVIVSGINSYKVYAMGNGVRSGAVSLKTSTTLLQFLAIAGLTERADLQNAYLLRNKERIGVDFYKLWVKGDISQSVLLVPGDIIFVPDDFEKRINLVGQVRTPQVINYKEGLTVVDVVLIAGGVTEFASANSTVVMRKSGKEIKEIKVRLNDVLKKGDISQNVVLLPGDTVIVPEGLF